MRRRRPRAAVVGVLALVGLIGLLWLEGFGPHTDDGCQTEVHCLACRTAFVRSSFVPAALAVAPALVALESVPVQPAARATEVFPTGRSSRGPPLSS